MSYLKLAKALLTVSGLLVLASVALLVYPSPKLSIEFTGGTLMELMLPEGKTKDDLLLSLRSFSTEHPIESPFIAQTKTGSFFVRMTTLGPEEHTALLGHLTENLGPLTELQHTTIGPAVGSTLKRRAVIALGIAMIATVLYLALAFRKLPQKLNPWSFGVCAVIALIHDVLITVGIFTILSHTTSFQMDTLFVTALLSIMGYSVSDTIVIFDRIRDNLYLEGNRTDFATITEMSIRQSLSRTLNTGLGALIMLTALFFLGSESIRWFMLALIVGTVIGTYSSFFVASPILIFWKKSRSGA